MGGHALRKAVHEGLRLDVEIAKHVIRTPAAEQLDFVLVDIGAQKSHGTPSAEAAGFNFFCGKAKGGFSEDEDCGAEGLGDVRWLDAKPFGGVVRGKGRSRG